METDLKKLFLMVLLKGCPYFPTNILFFHEIFKGKSHKGRSGRHPKAG